MFEPRQHILTATALATLVSTASASVIGFTDYEEWKQAVGSYQTIDFTGWEQYTIITDQYSHLGVTFTDGNDFIVNFPNTFKDGWGLDGSNFDKQITIAFDTPQLWIGIDHPGAAAIDLYYDSELIASFMFKQNGIGNFTGMVSTHAFDKAVIHRFPFGGGWNVTPPVIDDLHWGVPAPGAVGVFALALLCGGSRRRRK